MKICPSCQRTYRDGASDFCVQDGARLVSQTASSELCARRLRRASIAAAQVELFTMACHSDSRIFTENKLASVRKKQPYAPIFRNILSIMAEHYPCFARNGFRSISDFLYSSRSRSLQTMVSDIVMGLVAASFLLPVLSVVWTEYRQQITFRAFCQRSAVNADFHSGDRTFYLFRICTRHEGRFRGSTTRWNEFICYIVFTFRCSSKPYTRYHLCCFGADILEALV